MAIGGKRKGAGRPKGSVNKRKEKIDRMLQEMGCDPIEGMAHIAMEARADADKFTDFKDRKEALALAGTMYKELAQYVAPKLRAVELSSDPDQPFTTKIEILPVASTDKPKAAAATTEA